MKIRIPNNNIAERTYIVDVMFGVFLGTEHEIEVYDGNDYEIYVGEGRTILIRDAFFNQYPEPLTYLSQESIPKTISYSENRFTKEENIPILYGSGELKIKSDRIECGIDLFAASFFMLTRWEEHVIEERDRHGRVADHLQYTLKHGVYERPIVNEYAEMLKQMIRFLGVEIPGKHVYRLVITHDIDFFLRYDTVFKFLKAVSGDILKRKSIKEAIHTLRSYKRIKAGTQKDPYDTFDWLMELSENEGMKSIFYFMPSCKGEPDAHYDILDEAPIATIKKISGKGHTIGVHGAYRSYHKAELYQEELGRFPKGIQLEENRQHYLRFEVPQTFEILDVSGIKTDSSIGFTEKAGFRAGTCYEYPLFNILTRKQLMLTERPLIVMEQALRKQAPGSNDFILKISELKETVKKYSGTFVLLWHNTNFNTKEWSGYTDIYKSVIRDI